LYEGIVCPKGHYKVKQDEYDQQCSNIGLPCPNGYKCYCRPCLKAFEVDVLQLDGDEEASGLVVAGSSTHGCDKMALCGSVEQTKVVKFRAYDNREREGAIVTAVMHVRQDSFPLPVTRAGNNSFAYDFTFSNDELGVSILEVMVNGLQVPESPFRVEVVARDCYKDYPGQGKEPVRLVLFACLYSCSLMIPYSNLR
jgi:hypothetical protein